MILFTIAIVKSISLPIFPQDRFPLELQKKRVNLALNSNLYFFFLTRISVSLLSASTL